MTARTPLAIGMTLVAAISAAGQDKLAEDRALLSAAAAQRGAPAAAADTARTAVPAKPGSTTCVTFGGEAHAQAEVALASARLELIRARKADKQRDSRLAAEHACRALQHIAAVPTTVDLGEWQLQAEGLLARARKAGIDVDAMLAAPALSQASQPGGVSVSTIAPGEPATPTMPANPQPSPAAPHAPPMHDPTSLSGQVRQRERIATDEVRHLVEADDARIAGSGEVQYPADWRERMARRQRYAGGETARTQAWRDADGRERYAAIYDVRDVTYVAPDFRPPSVSMYEGLRDALDRDALRNRSLIFGGDALDLAHGIPLLHYFGGVDEMALRGPKYSEQRQRDVAEMIKAATGQDAENKIIMLAP